MSTPLNILVRKTALDVFKEHGKDTQKLMRFKRLFEESSDTMVHGILKKLPFSWVDSFKQEFLEDYELAPKNLTKKAMLKFNFQTNTYDQIIIPKILKEKHPDLQQVCLELTEELKTIQNLNPLKIHFANLMTEKVLYYLGYTFMFQMSILTLFSLNNDQSDFFNNTFWMIIATSFLVIIWMGNL